MADNESEKGVEGQVVQQQAESGKAPAAAKAGGEMSVREAGRKGGEKGGQTTKERYGTPFYKEIGRKGGETVRNERGHEFYEEIGRKGGQKVRELINEGKRLNKAAAAAAAEKKPTE